MNSFERLKSIANAAQEFKKDLDAPSYISMQSALYETKIDPIKYENSIFKDLADDISRHQDETNKILETLIEKQKSDHIQQEKVDKRRFLVTTIIGIFTLIATIIGLFIAKGFI